MSEMISPKYQMVLVKQIADAIWDTYKTYKDVLFYIRKWHVVENELYNNFWENFSIIIKDDKQIDLLATLHNIEDGNLILKIAIDLGVETPDFIPSIPTFRNAIKSDYSAASAIFEKAFKQIETHPDIAIGLANSALESIIKEIIKDDRIKTEFSPNKTLYDLTRDLLKELYLFPEASMPEEIKTIGRSIIAVNQGIEKLRSEKTTLHGKTETDYLIEDPLYAYFIINSVTTVGLFLRSFYLKKFPKKQIVQTYSPDDLPF